MSNATREIFHFDSSPAKCLRLARLMLKTSMAKYTQINAVNKLKSNKEYIM